MLFLYNILMHSVGFLLKIIALFNKKIGLFISGRKQSFQLLSDQLQPHDKTIWFHAASLGEYEQGLPVMEQLKAKFPNHIVVLTFFSPSGYEVRKNSPIADLTLYLPWDTKHNAKKFIRLVKPELVVFVKYEFWISYLNELQQQHIPTYLISGVFRQDQAFFKWYGGFYRKALKAFNHFFVQNQNAAQLLRGLGFTNVSVSGDTRFDRVFAISERDNQLEFVKEFKADKHLVVAGSTWEADERLWVTYINTSESSAKFIIAPHNIKTEQIAALQSQIKKSVVLFSELDSVSNLSEKQVLIIDNVGLLTKIYSYADLAYVGGGFGHPGVHNVLEPAVFSIPIVIGKNYTHFAEATALVELNGIVSIDSQKQFDQVVDKLLSDKKLRSEKGKICSDYVLAQKGATQIIVDYLVNKEASKNLTEI